jgi:hypothetical protein
MGQVRAVELNIKRENASDVKIKSNPSLSHIALSAIYVNDDLMLPMRWLPSDPFESIASILPK